MKSTLKKLALLALITLCAIVSVRAAYAAESRYEGVVTEIKQQKTIEVMGKKQLYQKLAVMITDSNLKGKTIVVENGNTPVARSLTYNKAERIIITQSEGPNGSVFYVSDYMRRDQLYWLFLLFVLITVVIGKWRGLASVIGMVVSFYVIFSFVLPQILSGQNPIIAAIFAAFFIIPITFYLSHGFNKKTTIAIVGTVIALIATGILASIYVESAKLTGYSSEESAFLQSAKPDLINMKGLLLAGIIIGLLGILDDITISQAAIVAQLKETSPKMTFKELYKRGMNIGTDHIASMVNTLVLVYAGAAMPLLLLFINNPHPFSEVINYEIIAEEVVRTLVASIGLILAVPITTFIAAYWLKDEHKIH